MSFAFRPVPTVVIVAYQSDDHLSECLQALGDPNSVIVVDNGASDTTCRLVEANGARYVRSPGNVGFAAAVNRGLEAAWDGRSDVLLLNPDARIRAADVRVLQEALHAPGTRRAAVGPRLIGEDGEPQLPEWPLPSPGQVWFDAVGLGRLWRGDKFVVGAVLLLRGDALAEVGNLDERYFLYAEEADWQMRAIRAGWTVAVVHAVSASHVGSASSGDPTLRDRLFHTSAAIFAHRWYGPAGSFAMRMGSLLAAGRRSLVGSTESRRRNRKVARLYLRDPARLDAQGEER